MAHLRELDGGRWQIMYDIGPDPVTGRRRQRSKTIDGSEEDALRFAAKLESSARRAVDGASGSTRLGSFVDLFLEALRKRQPPRAPGTIAWYEDKLGYAVDAMGSRKLSQINGGMLTVFYGRLLDRGLSPTTVSHTHGAIRACLNQAVRWGYIADNPAHQADPPGRATAERDTWSADELRRFLTAAADTPWLVAWTLLAVTGMRRSEVAGLRWANVDLDAGVVHVREALTSTRSKLRFGPPKSRAGIRSIAVDASTVELLSQHRRRQVAARLQLGGGYEDHDLVSCWEDGKPVNPDVLTRAFRRINDRLELPYITLHDLRHTWATLALEGGVALKVVSQRLGHSSIKVTADVYTHVVDEVDRAAAETVARIIRGRSGGS